MKSILKYLAVIAAIVPVTANAASIVVTDAKIEAGKLIVTGKTPNASQSISLDGLFTINSNASKEFSFSITTYVPSDCVASLKAGTTTKSAVVANCGRGVSARGAWKSTVSYHVDDLVTHSGSTWIAVDDNKNMTPANNSTVWEVFAAKGSTGAAGPAGAAGPKGSKGAQGDPGAQGAQGDTGPAGPAGPQGAVGPQGPKAVTGANITGNIGFSAIPANSCGTLTLGISGAMVGDAGILSTSGTLPSGITISFTGVTAANTVKGLACNHKNTGSTAVTNLPVHVVTFR